MLLLEKLAEKWRRDSEQYGRQVDEARIAGTPYEQMQLAQRLLWQCSKDLTATIKKQEAGSVKRSLVMGPIPSGLTNDQTLPEKGT